jgi:hypothetical protein
VQRWHGRVTDRGLEAIREQAVRKAGQLGLDEQPLITRVRQDVDGVLKKNPDQLFAQLAAPSPPEGEESAAVPGTEPPAAVLQRVDEALGSGASAEGQSAGTPTSFETELQRHADALGERLAQSALTWLLEWVEAPEHRLKAAQAAGRFLGEHLRATAEAAAARLAQLRTQRRLLRQRLLKGDSGSVIKLLSIPGLGQSEAEKRTGRVVDYCWVRLAELVLEAALEVLASVGRELSPFLQDLVLCQHKLNLLAEQFAPPVSAAAAPAPNALEVLPWGARTRADAAAAVLERLAPERFRSFEESLMTAVVEPQGGVGAALGIGNTPDPAQVSQASASLAFWNLVTGPGEVAQKLTERMIGQAQAFIGDTLADLDAAGLFLEVATDEALAVLTAHVQATRPHLLVAGAWEHLVVVLPESPAGASLRELVLRSAGGMPLSLCPGATDVCLCREVACQPLPVVAGALVSGQASASELAQRVLTRTDVNWLPLSLPAADDKVTR